MMMMVMMVVVLVIVMVRVGWGWWIPKIVVIVGIVRRGDGSIIIRRDATCGSITTTSGTPTNTKGW